MQTFCETYTLSSLFKEPTNSHYSFQNSCVIETGLSDFHNMMTVTVTKTTYEKLKPRIVNYRDYKFFFNHTFQQILLEKLSTENINTN